ncbi:MAG: hypothetical protein FJX77_16275, partial [Armatimonadetes bacterium]|nr:hypothetical protein [Armatimonadota bacterium]
DPHPEAANTPEPGKRPLNNMCPTVVLRRGVPYTALGAAGGRRIVTSVFEVLLQIVAHDRAPAAALQAPRLHTEGDGAVTVDAGMAEEQAQFLAGLGYTVRRGAMANVSLVTK